MDKKLITVLGPTAIGKTNLAIKLANHFDTEIISADSRQFFKEMQIGTAVPTAEEQQRAPHHFIQHISIDDHYNVGQYEQDALTKIEELFKTHDILILVGGSGLYVDAVINGLDYFPNIDPTVRKEVRETFGGKDIQRAQEKLKTLDPVYYQQVDLSNGQRVLRALEVCISSGRPYSSFLEKRKPKRPFLPLKIGLTTERSIIYDRINKRVDLMMQEGLENEARHLFPYRENNALNTVGYKELFNYFEGNYDKKTAVAEIKKNTRRFAKRQLTWFRKDTEIYWFDLTTDFHKVVKFIEDQL